MKCESCGVKINTEFTYAVKNNLCPACGNAIMKPDKLLSFLSLKSLLEDQIVVKGVDTNKLALLIVSNFELKQLFKDAPKSNLKKDDEEGIIEVDEEDPDAEYKKAQAMEAKEILKKMRDEALSGATLDRYGVGRDGDELDPLDDDIDPYELVNKQLQEQRKEMVANGSGGIFSRAKE